MASLPEFYAPAAIDVDDLIERQGRDDVKAGMVGLKMQVISYSTENGFESTMKYYRYADVSKALLDIKSNIELILKEGVTINFMSRDTGMLIAFCTFGATTGQYIWKLYCTDQQLRDSYKWFEQVAALYPEPKVEAA